MAALPDENYGIDPESMEPMAMPEDGGEQLPPELMEMMGGDPSVDPGAPPADPMLEQEPVEDEYGDEVEERNKVELCLLGAIEACAKGVETGVGAANAQVAAQYGQAAAALAQAFEALMRTEQAEKDAAQQGPSWDEPVDPSSIRI